MKVLIRAIVALIILAVFFSLEALFHWEKHVEKIYKPTVIFILLVVAAITIFDIWCAATNTDRTISWVLYTAAHRWPVIPMIFGFFGGHLFFPNCPDEPTTKAP